MSEHAKGGIELLVGHRLLGYMPMTDKDPGGTYGGDNAIALYIGDKDHPTEYVLHSENQDYSMYDVWVLENAKEHIPRDDRYKAIGEKILEVSDSSSEVKGWSDDTDQYWLTIRTRSKVLRMGHHWNDCHYPNSLWDEIPAKGIQGRVP